MSQNLWRIAADTAFYAADDRSGGGAGATGGRWNARDHPVIYASGSRALACLETVVHLNASGLPLNRYLVQVVVDDAVWQRALRETAESMAVGWDAEPASRTSIEFGTNWIKSGATALLIVPSAIVPEEFNVLLIRTCPGSR